MTDSLIGSVVAGYRLERLIGRGGMGVVYAAVELELGRRVALKLVAPDMAGDREFRDRFVAESRLAASIEHPAFLPVYRAGEADGRLFLAMRLIAGDDLATLVRRDGPLGLDSAARIVAQVAAALDAAHERRLVHRDVKPANVLIDGEGRAYLMDFGLAKDLEASVARTQAGTVVGTVDYLAPEQIQAGAVGPWTDIYALGCVLFFATTGRVVFPLDGTVRKLWAHLSEPPPRPSALRPELPAALDRVVERALAKDPRDRWPAAGALASAALEAAAGDEPSSELPGRPAPVERRISSAQLVGREPHLAELETALAHARQGVPALVVIEGEAGAGKTRLAREFAGRARSAGSRVMWGECVPTDAGELPYAPIIAALRALRRDSDLGPAASELSGLIPALAERGRAAPFEARAAEQTRLFELLLGLLRRLGAEAPVLLVVEDLHWADHATQDLLSFLARNLADERLLIAATVRSDELGASLLELLVELTRRDRVQRLELGPLTPQESARQIAGITDADSALVEAVYALAEGNPYFTEELVAARTTGDSMTLPRSLRDALRVRMAKLPDTAAQVARLAAAAGRDVDAEILQRAGSLGDAEFSSALRALIDAHVLVSDRSGERFGFRHALGREAVFQELLAPERRILHAAIAEALEGAIPDSERDPGDWAALAHHWHGARRPPPALRASIAASAAAARVFAFAAARGHLERARALWPSVAPDERPAGLDEPELLRRFAEVTLLDGDWHAALAIGKDALALVDPDARPQTAANIHELLGRLHRSPDGAIREFDCALRLLPDGPSAQRARLIIARSRMRQYGQWPSTTLEPALEALGVAEAVGADAERGHAHEQLGKAHSFGGDPDTGIPHYREAMRVAKELGRVEDLATAITSLGATLIMLGRLDEAFEHLEAGLRDVREGGLGLSYGVVIEAHLADCELRLGRWHESRERLDRLLRGGARNDDGRLHLLGLRLALDAREGRFDAAAECEHAAVALMNADLWPQTVVIANCARAELALLRGDLDAAATIVAETRAAVFCGDLVWWPTLLALGLRAAADRAVRARAEGRDDVLPDALTLARTLIGSADIQGSLLWARFERPVADPAPPETAAHRLQGAAELARLEGAHRPDLWADVVGCWDRLRYPYQAAYARLRAGEAQLMTGGDAQPTLRDAAAALARLGATPLLAAVDALGAGDDATVPARSASLTPPNS